MYYCCCCLLSKMVAVLQYTYKKNYEKKFKRKRNRTKQKSYSNGVGKLKNFDGIFNSPHLLKYNFFSHFIYFGLKCYPAKKKQTAIVLNIDRSKIHVIYFLNFRLKRKRKRKKKRVSLLMFIRHLIWKSLHVFSLVCVSYVILF